MGYGNFTGCTSLESIEVAPGNAHYTSLDGALVEDGFSLLAYPNKKGVRYEVPDEIKVLEHYSCCWTDLQEIILPQWIYLGYLALGYCHDLVSVTTRQTNPMDIDNDQLNSLLTTIKNQGDEIEMKTKEIERLQTKIEKIESESDKIREQMDAKKKPAKKPAAKKAPAKKK
jgi:hypothetical protein